MRCRMVRALQIAFAPDVVDLLEALGERAGQRRVDFRFAPEIIFAFFAFGIGIETGGKRIFHAHVAQQPADRLLDAFAIERIAAVLPDQRQHVDEQRIVVKHFLEMRDQPAFVGGIAREAAADMIVDAAHAHIVERGLHQLEELRRRRCADRRARAVRSIPRLGNFGAPDMPP